MKLFKKGQFIFVLIMLILLAGCNELTSVTTTTEALATLATPNNIRIENDILTWDNVIEANEYVVIVDDEEHTVTTNSFDLTTLTLTEGNHLISVKSVNNEGTSNPTASISYVITDMDIVQALIVEFDVTYELDMTEDDFDYEADYKEYTYALMFSEAYADAVLRQGISSESAIQIIGEIKMISEQLPTTNSLIGVKALLDGLFDETGLDSEKFANILVDLADIMIDINLLVQTEPDTLETLNQIDTLLNNEREAFVDAFKSAADYSLNVYGQLDESLITNLNKLLTGEELTVGEIFILKDEIHLVLDETLPSIEDYENIYTVYALILTMFSDDEATIDEAFITTLASMAHYSNQLYIDLIGDIDEQVYNDVVLIVTDLYTPGYCETVENYDYSCYGPQYDVNKIVELILYIDQFVTDFKTNHQTTIDEINNLHTDEFKNKMYTMIEDAMIATLEEAYAGDLYLDQRIAIVEDIFDNISIFEDAFAVYERLGLNAYNHFIDTEGQLIIDLNNLINTNTPDPTTIVSDVESIFSQFLGYYNITSGAITIEDLTSMFTMMMYTAELSFIQTGAPIDLDNLIETLPPVLAEIFHPFIEVQTDFLNNIDQNDVISAIFNYGEAITIYDRVIAEFIINLDATLTTEVQAELRTSVERLFDEVFGNQTVMFMMDITTDDLAVAKTMALNGLDAFFAQLELVASYDFENLTAEQQIEVNVLIGMLTIGMGFGREEPVVPENSIPVTLDSITDEILLEGEIDYFELVITETQIVSIYTLSSLDLRGALYDHKFNLIIDDDDSGENFNFLFEAELEPGVYYIFVEGYDENETGSYQLYIETYEEDFEAFANLANWFGEVAYSSIPTSGDNEVGNYLEVTIEQLITEGQLPADTFSNYTGIMRFEVDSNGYYNPVSFLMESDTLYVSRTGTASQPIYLYYSSDDVIIK